jgi:uncharacterized membrane protein (DUF4010 family)
LCEANEVHVPVAHVDVLGLLIAALGGTAVGIERQWSGHAEGPEARFAGIRTFTLIGALGGLSGALWALGLTAIAVVVVSAGAALTVAAYVAGSRRDIDGTTETAALVVLTVGIFAGLGFYKLASGSVAVTCLLLVEKSRLHSLVARVDDVALRAGVRFGVMALVVLPLLPEGPFGPFGGIRPRELWALVLFFSGLSFLGYIARRLLGPSQGYLVAGLLGGLVSSTNVTFTFARTSRVEQAMDRALAFGAIGANAMLYPRVLLAVGVLNLPLLPSVARYLVAPSLVALIAIVVGMRRSRGDEAPVSAMTNPLQLTAALQMALVFQVMLMVVHTAGKMWGSAGVYASAAVLGLTDVDALTVSMARGVAYAASIDTAALAIAIGVLANTLMKLALASIFGSPRFQRVAGGTLVLISLVAIATLVVTAGISR